MSDSLITLARLFNKEVQLISMIEEDDSLSRCVALATSMEYHMTGEFTSIASPEVLAGMYDKVLLIYDTRTKTLERCNDVGVGHVLLFRLDKETYQLASVPDGDGQYITCFSIYHPLIVELLKHIT